MTGRLDWIPARRSPRWAAVFGIGTLVLATALVTAGALNRGDVSGEVALNVSLVSAIIVGTLALAGWLGARLTFFVASIGLTLGYVQMVWTFVRSNDGFADLAALAGFLMLGTIGVGVGIIADVVWWIRRRRAAVD